MVDREEVRLEPSWEIRRFQGGLKGTPTFVGPAGNTTPPHSEDK